MMSTRKIKWGKSDEGYTESTCGKFEIEPVFIGRVSPQGYTLYRIDGEQKREAIKKSFDTQKEAKQHAEKLNDETT